MFYKNYFIKYIILLYINKIEYFFLFCVRVFLFFYELRKNIFQIYRNTYFIKSIAIYEISAKKINFCLFISSNR